MAIILDVNSILFPERDYVTLGYLLSQMSVVCDLRARYVAGGNFRQCFYAILYLTMQNLSKILPGEPLRRGLNA